MHSSLYSTISRPEHCTKITELREHYRTINNTENRHPETALIVETSTVTEESFPKFYQLITVNTRGGGCLDHAYTQLCNANKPLPHPSFGKSDYSSILLVPAYKHKLKMSPPIMHISLCWSVESDAVHQDCFYSMTEFAGNRGDVNKIAEGTLGLIRKVIEDVVPKKTVMFIQTGNHGFISTSKQHKLQGKRH
jgi:hypothetical protein